MKYRLLGIWDCLCDAFAALIMMVVYAIEKEENEVDQQYHEAMREIVSCKDDTELQTSLSNIYALYTKYKAQLPYDELTKRHNQLQKLWGKQKQRIDGRKYQFTV